MASNAEHVQIHNHEARLQVLEEKNGWRDGQINELRADVKDIKGGIEALKISNARQQVVIGIVTAVLTTCLTAPASAIAAGAAVLLLK